LPSTVARVEACSPFDLFQGLTPLAIYGRAFGTCRLRCAKSGRWKIALSCSASDGGSCRVGIADRNGFSFLASKAIDIMVLTGLRKSWVYLRCRLRSGTIAGAGGLNRWSRTRFGVEERSGFAGYVSAARTGVTSPTHEAGAGDWKGHFLLSRLDLLEI
jgi:hypothetical protein